jgi:LemA protein
MVAALVSIFGIILLLVIVVLAYIFITQRELVKLDELCRNAMSQISVQLNSRWDAVTSLAQTAMRYSKHEAETLQKTIAERRQGNVTTAQDVNQQQNALTDIMSRLMVVVERYPELKANELFIKVQDGAVKYEENVRMSRMVYNDTVTKINRMVRQWPSSFVASLLHFTEREYLEVDEPQKKQAPNLNDIYGN